MMPDIERAAYLAHARSPVFARRAKEAEVTLRRAAEAGAVVIMSSWGKDSVVLCDIACRLWERPTILHIASSYRIPGWESVQDHFASRANLHVIEPSRTLEETIEWLREVGLPHERTKAQQMRVVKTIKKDVGASWCKEHGYAVQALGLRADESKARRDWLRRVGTLYEAQGVKIVAPLAWWSARDVWAYIVSRGLPYHPMYDLQTDGVTRETQRNTGWLSTDGAHDGRIAWLRRHYTELYRALAAHFPDVRRFT